jgi:hypothetical protein
MKLAGAVKRPEQIEFFLRLLGLWEGIIQLPRPPPPPFDIETMEPIEPPWQAIKEWIPDAEPDLDWFNRPRNPNEPDPDWFDQSQTWQAPEIHLEDRRILILRIHLRGVPPVCQFEKPPPKEILAKRPGKPRSHRMKTAVKSPNPAKSRRPAEHSSFQRFSFQHFSSTQIPPFSPASGPATRSFNGLHLKSNFLAINCRFETAATGQSPLLSTLMKASCGMFTLPNIFIFFFPSFCFSNSLRFRVMSPP